MANNWIMYHSERAVEVKESRESIYTPGCGWGAETKRVLEVCQTLFGAGAYTASDNALRGNSGLATRDYKIRTVEVD